MTLSSKQKITGASILTIVLALLAPQLRSLLAICEKLPFRWKSFDLAVLLDVPVP